MSDQIFIFHGGFLICYEYFKKIAPIEVKQKSGWAPVRVSVSYTGWFENLPNTNIYTSHAQLSNHPDSGANLTPDSESLSCEYRVRNPIASEGVQLGSRKTKTSVSSQIF